MAIAEITSKQRRVDDHDEPAAPLREPVSRRPAPPRAKLLPFLITLVAVIIAVFLGRTMWGAYMESPWTRNATVRAYVVAIAPEVPGRIVELHVRDNQHVRRGELLMVIDPTNYEIAVSQAEAAVQQARASLETNEAQMLVQQAQISANEAQLEQTQAGLVFAHQQAERYTELARRNAGSVQNAQQFSSQLHQQQSAVRTAEANRALAQRQIQSLRAQRMAAEASLAQANAQLRQAQANLERTRIASPVDGHVTNLLARVGDYMNVSVHAVSVVDDTSFWVDGYFEETNLEPIRVGDPARIKLIGYGPILRGHVDSVARAINVANAQPNNQGLATVNPIFTWVRLAQRIPVRIRIDGVPPEVFLAAGMTATVEIDSQAQVEARAAP